MKFPLVFENISNQTDIQKVVDYLDTNSKDFGELSDSDYWKGRTLFYGDIKDSDVQQIMVDSLRNIINVLESNFDKKIYCEHFSVAKWPTGYDLAPHGDAENPPEFPPHPYPWRDFGTVTFLNEDFTGGILHYPNKNIEIKPKKGYSAVHLGNVDYLHGVTKITSGNRYTIASFLTYDKSKKSIDI
jgi:hypothetical protein